MENQPKRQKLLDTHEEFSVRFIETLGYKRSSLFLFANEDVHDLKNFLDYSIEDVVKAIRHGGYIADFEGAVERVYRTKSGKQRLWDLFVRYFPESTEPFEGFAIGLTMRFYKDKWPQGGFYDYSRRQEEGDILNEIERLSHVNLGISVPAEIGMEILSYFERNYELICTIGLIDEGWYRMVLENFNELKLTEKSDLEKIPLTVTRNLKKIVLSFKTPYWHNTVDDTVVAAQFFNDVVDRITPRKVTELDFSGFSPKLNFGRKNEGRFKSVNFPNLKKLHSAPNSFLFWDMMKDVHFQKLRHYSGKLLDFGEKTGFNKLKNFRIDTLNIICRDENRDVRMTEEYFQRCLNNLYIFQNIRVLGIWGHGGCAEGYLIHDKTGNYHNPFHMGWIISGPSFLTNEEGKFLEMFRRKKFLIDMARFEKLVDVVVHEISVGRIGYPFVPSFFVNCSKTRRKYGSLTICSTSPIVFIPPRNRWDVPNESYILRKQIPALMGEECIIKELEVNVEKPRLDIRAGQYLEGFTKEMDNLIKQYSKDIECISIRFKCLLKIRSQSAKKKFSTRRVTRKMRKKAVEETNVKGMILSVILSIQQNGAVGSMRTGRKGDIYDPSDFKVIFNREWEKYTWFFSNLRARMKKKMGSFDSDDISGYFSRYRT